MKTEVEKFCAKHHACPEGIAFATRYTTLADVWANCERGDWMLWMLQRGPKQEREVWVRVAYESALHVLPIFERAMKGDCRPRKCLELLFQWLDKPESVNRLALLSVARGALAARADAAYATAYAADAAHATAYAAYAAADAAYATAYAAAYAAYAYADAAYSAAYAADAERKRQAGMLRRVVGNPFDGWTEGGK